MPAAKRHPKKHSKLDKSTVPSSASDGKQHTAVNTTKPTVPRQSYQHNRRRGCSHRTWLESAFRKQYYPHWIAISLIALLLAVGYHRWDVVTGFVRGMSNRPWKVIGGEQSWQDGWLSGGDIDRRSNLSLQEFRQVYDGKRPVLITDVLQDWGAMRWNREYFVSRYGKHRVAMKAVEGTLDQAEGFSLPLEMFVAHVQDSSPHRWTYVEDELFIPHTANLRKDIGSCPYLEEDFFKLFPKEIRPWDAMLLWGTRYSRSSLHIDPYNWTGTNAVIKGMKQWKVYPPGQDEHLYVLPDRMSGFPLKSYKYNSPVDAFAPNLERYPNFAKAKAVEFTQYPGELLFIPTGWFHQAYNAKETIAVSGQVMNTANYRMVLEEIFKAGSVDMRSLPTNFDDMAPIEQVRAAIQSIPQSILDEGRRVTQNALNEVKRTPHEHN